MKLTKMKNAVYVNPKGWIVSSAKIKQEYYPPIDHFYQQIFFSHELLNYNYFYNFS